MADYFSTLLFWHWWVLGLVLVVIEMIAPGFFLLWIGLAAGVTGLILVDRAGRRLAVAVPDLRACWRSAR